MIYLAVPDLSGNERKYLNECIDTTFVSTVGEFVTRFEKQVARKTGAAYGTVVSSGTDGLHLALTACGVERDEKEKNTSSEIVSIIKHYLQKGIDIKNFMT